MTFNLEEKRYYSPTLEEVLAEVHQDLRGTFGKEFTVDKGSTVGFPKLHIDPEIEFKVWDNLEQVYGKER